MLKITFTVESNVRYKNSNARLFRLYKRLYLFECYFATVFKCNRILCGGSKINMSSSYRRHKTVIMRSPFHYKTSKTILSQPKQNMTFSFTLRGVKWAPLFFNADLQKLLKQINTLNILVFKKINVSHVC